MKRSCYLALICTLPLLASPAWAAPPDAGSVLRDELRRDQAPAPLMPPKPEKSEAAQAAEDKGPKITIKAFKLNGLSALPEAEAQAFLAPYLGQSLGLGALNKLAENFEQWLRSRGLFAARAWIPPQKSEDGVVEIRILEGRVEGIDIKKTGETRFAEERIRATLSEALPDGSALEQRRLERGLLLLNDLPVLSARAVMVPGKDPGGSRVLIEAAQGNVLSGTLEADNTGNRYTGELRFGGALTVNDALGTGDQWSLRGSQSRGSTFARAGYAVPLGNNGLKAGLALIGSRYRLHGDASEVPDDSHGEAIALSAFTSYPFIRTRLLNLGGSASLANKKFENWAAGSLTSDKASNSFTLGLSGNWTEMSGLGVYNSYALQWTSGDLDLKDPADSRQDGQSAQSQGGYDKLNAQISRLQRLTESGALYLGFAGQMARKNLDSSEKFTLGGPQGVRAYPNGEGAGDQGWMVNLEWRQEIDKDWRMIFFIDHGEIWLHRDLWADWNSTQPGLPNNYDLSGAGGTLAWRPSILSEISATVASRLGKNPARNSAGQDSDNRPARVQLWLQASMNF